MNQVLNLQIQLLLHQHGRKDVMEALAIVEDADLASRTKLSHCGTS